MVIVVKEFPGLGQITQRTDVAKGVADVRTGRNSRSHDRAAIRDGLRGNGLER